MSRASGIERSVSTWDFDSRSLVPLREIPSRRNPSVNHTRRRDSQSDDIEIALMRDSHYESLTNRRINAARARITVNPIRAIIIDFYFGRREQRLGEDCYLARINGPI